MQTAGGERHLKVYWKHLRVPFQLSLAPLFLWGYFLGAPESVSVPHPVELVIGFAAFHFCLYTGITAFNSHYDRDTGPVGGMLHPPPVPERLLQLSIGLQALGWLLAAMVSWVFAAIYSVVAALGVAYSHPRIRWKARPVLSALTVLIGQGVAAYLAGWTTARGGLVDLSGDRGMGGLMSASFTTLGLYPLTQVYQIDEDRARGDTTLAVRLGAVRALTLGIACLSIAAVAAVLTMMRTAKPLDALLVAGAYLFVLIRVGGFAVAYAKRRHTIESAHRFTMRLNYLVSAGFAVFILLHLARLL